MKCSIDVVSNTALHHPPKRDCETRRRENLEQDRGQARTDAAVSAFIASARVLSKYAFGLVVMCYLSECCIR
ncbi:hypothetical protein SAMN05414139_09686 [Burkholderia sp. D7]|nr:hypothetical protein SAMN05414139_09686 [Burkholderia sp. D7]